MKTLLCNRFLKLWLYWMFPFFAVGLFSCSSEDNSLSVYKDITEDFAAARREPGVKLLDGKIRQSAGTSVHYYAFLPQQASLKLEFTTENSRLKGVVRLHSDGAPAKEFQLKRRKSHSLDLSEFANRAVKISLLTDGVSKNASLDTQAEKPFLEWSIAQILIPAAEMIDNQRVRKTEEYQMLQQHLKEYNVMYIVFDAFHAKHSSLYGYSRKTTPFLDELAKESVVFENMFANAPYTLASTANLVTGRYSFEHGLLNQKSRILPVLPTIAELLSVVDVESYLLTAHPFVGDDTWGLPRGFTSSFFRNYETATTYYTLNEVVFEALGKLHVPGDRLESLRTIQETVFYKYAEFAKAVKKHLGKEHFVAHRRLIKKHAKQTERRTDYQRVLEEIKSIYAANTQKQKFLYVHLLPPHGPYLPPDEFRVFMEEPLKAIEPNTPNLSRIDSGKLSLNDEQLDYIISLYDGNILFTDHMAREIFEFLEEQKILDNTIVFISSDHGEAFMEHGRILHNTTVFDEMIHVPLLVHFPPALHLPPKRLSHLASVVDIAPTLAEIYDLADAPEFSGRSLLPLILSDSAPNPRTFIFSESPLTKTQTVRDRSYKYLARFGKKSMLFDLENDPLEQKDLRDVMPITSGYYQQLIVPFLKNPPVTNSNEATEPLNEEIIQDLKDLGYIK